jgi:hypothetical protein
MCILLLTETLTSLSFATFFLDLQQQQFLPKHDRHNPQRDIIIYG